MLRDLLGADFERRLHLLQTTDVQSLGAQFSGQLARMRDQFRIRSRALRRIQRVGVAYPTVVEIGHRRKLAAVKKTANENKRRCRDRTAASILREQMKRIESVRGRDHLAPL